MATRRTLVAKVLRELGFKSNEAALNEITLLNAASQLAQYEEECARFTRKYRMSLHHLEQRLRRRRGVESFAAEDDLMAWRFAHDAAEYWRPRVAGLRRAV